jgi:hypothetical protein
MSHRSVEGRGMGDEGRRFAGVDTSTPNLARMHDYFIGGKDNFAADREAAEAVLAIAPEVRVMALEHQAFHVRVIRFLAEQGITQFVNLGSGQPTEHNTHQLARSLAPDARVVYVANDPVVLTHWPGDPRQGARDRRRRGRRHASCRSARRPPSPADDRPRSAGGGVAVRRPAVHPGRQRSLPARGRIA